jgi:hypothetical protein
VLRDESDSVPAQLVSVSNLLLNPVRTVRWTTSHASQPLSAATRTGPMYATAWKRGIVAIVPRSR